MTRRLVSLRTTLAIAAVALALLIVPASAHAATVINFDQVSQGGTVTDDGFGNAVGTNIVFEFITYENPVGTTVSTAYCGTLATDNCLLNFNSGTGSFIVTAPSGLYEGDLTTQIAPPGSSVVTGTITNVLAWVPTVGFFATGVDTKNQALLDYFGVTATNFNFTNTEILLFLNPSGTVTEADFSNFPVVPEPGLLALFGLGLVGVGRQLARRRT